jgi:NhaP-type Na+/H+ or K+/H+ antiporter
LTVPFVFAVAAFIILTGFAGKILFQKTRIPDIPILLGIGVLMGPVLHLVNPDVLLSLAPYVGTLALLIWVRVLARTGRLPLSYMLTVAGMLFLYSLVETFHASGIFAVLVFGMVLSNGDVAMKWVPMPSKEASWESSRYALDDTIRWFHEEVAFIARVFFFVYLGMLMDFRQISPNFFGVSAMLIVIVYAARDVSVRAIGYMGRRQVPFERKILATMAPRGLPSAVLATIPTSEGIAGTEVYIQYAFAAIAVTNVLLTVSTVRSERRLDRIIAETSRTTRDADNGNSTP